MLHEQTFRPPSGRWPLRSGRCNDFGRQWRLLPSVLILMTSVAALFCTGCATTRKNRTEENRTEAVLQNRDSVATVTRVILKETVPMSRARIAVSVDSILSLPAGASYHCRSGQAGAEVSRKGDTIYVTATCDSLQREVEYYEELYSATREAYDRLRSDIQTEREQRPDTIKAALAALIAGLSAGVISTIIILTKNHHGKE